MADIENILINMQSDLKDVKTDIRGLKTDVGGLKTDVAGLKTDVGELKTDVAGLKTGMQTMEGEMQSFRIHIAEVDKNNNALYGKFCALEGHFYGMEERLNTKFDNLRDEMKQGFDGVGKYFRAIDNHITKHSDLLADHEHRIRNLEDEDK